jgi:hypothetical protein
MTTSLSFRLLSVLDIWDVSGKGRRKESVWQVEIDHYSICGSVWRRMVDYVTYCVWINHLSFNLSKLNFVFFSSFLSLKDKVSKMVLKVSTRWW